MVSAKNIIELLEKEKLAIYFVLLWAGSFFFWNLSYLISSLTYFGSALRGLAVLADMIELVAGIMLGLLGFKMLGIKFLPTLTKENLLVFFLLLWAGSFFFWGLYDIIDFGPLTVESGFRLLGTLCDVVAGAMLAIFGWKLLKDNEQSLPPPPPPPMP
jgi:hypothetical protein